MLSSVIEALKFAAEKHMSQRRKGCEAIPYINHPIKVTHLLYTVGKEYDSDILSAALMHDVLEDTDVTQQEMLEKFGERITNLVIELTDDMTLTYEDRKRMQIKKAPLLSKDAKKIKIADKISNIDDILSYPLTWSNRRKKQYLEWSEKVVKECRGVNEHLDKAFVEIFKKAQTIINTETN